MDLASVQQTAAIEELMESRELVDSNGRQIGPLGRGTRVFVLYFSAHWCPPCRQFTPVLRNTYTSFLSNLNSVSSKVQMVFVSSDRSIPEMLRYMKEAHGDWPAVPPGSGLHRSICSAFPVKGIPTLIAVDSYGEVITFEGRNEVMVRGASAFSTWHSSVKAYDLSVVESLKENSSEVARDACDILLKLLGNVLKDPQNFKFRTIRLSNPTIESKLLNAVGAFEILFSVGFEEDSENLFLPFCVPQQRIKCFKDEIEKVLKSIDQGSQPAAKIETGPPKTNRPVNPGTSARISELMKILGSAPSDVKGFEEKLLAELELAKAYENPRFQEEAKKCVPIERLQTKAREKLQLLPGKNENMFRRFYLKEVTRWFKTEFFTWFDGINCDSCNKPMESSGLKGATAQQLADGASRIESFRCKTCGKEGEFPRYHSYPVKLLTTRKGRCGEWTNCFALILRALGFDTRRVLDWTDHVWCEVYDSNEKRWIHVDPCECLIDTPLVYEEGWKKDLSYVIATSKDEIQDVTWRYSQNHQKVRQRRQLSNQWLTKTLLNMTDQCQSLLTPEEKEKLLERRLQELVELMSPPKRKPSEMELQGRQSGSVAWRQDRGEMGQVGHIWKLTPLEVTRKEFILEYDIISDKYTRVSNDNQIIPLWQKGVSEYTHIVRKEEFDWKMVYLARAEGSLKSKISWKLDLSDSKLSVRSVEVNVSSDEFESGQVMWQLCGDNVCLLPKSGVVLKSDELAGSKYVSVSASLKGGSGKEAWQHTQLFRTKMGSDEGAKFRMVVRLKED